MGDHLPREGEIVIKHLHISELRTGMYVTDIGIDLKQRPYLYIANELLTSEEQIQQILTQGFQEVYIDESRSSHPAASLPQKDNTEFSRLGKFASIKPTTALEEELPKAVKVHDESVAYARRFMNDMRGGKVNIAPAAKNMESIMGSLERNADALVSLSRLRRTDSYTYTHCVNVCILTTLFARYLDSDSDTIFTSGLAGMFHDLGKALVPPHILNAPRKLSDSEFAVMKAHPVLGYEQLATVPGMQPEVLLGAVQHHEKYNGTGYPQGLTGEHISDIGRMVGVADIYDALTSKRPYKNPMPPHKALSIMFEMRNKDLAYIDVARFIRMIGVYPVGSVVELEDGSTGVVYASNEEQPTKPVVIIVRAPDGSRLPGERCDLASANGGPAISGSLAANITDIDPAKILGIS